MSDARETAILLLSLLAVFKTFVLSILKTFVLSIFEWPPRQVSLLYIPVSDLERHW